MMNMLLGEGYRIAVDWTWHAEEGKSLEYASEDLMGVIGCDVFVFIDGIRSTGKFVELGIALGIDKPIIIYRPDRKPTNVFLKAGKLGNWFERAFSYNELLRILGEL